MLWKFPGVYGLVGLVVVGLAAGAIVWRFAFFFAPYAWTREPDRLAAVLGLRPGMHIADIGAGSGALAVAMAPFVGSTGRVYATELDPERLAGIERRVNGSSIGNVTTIAAEATDTRLPDGCCDGIYMRAVFHHIEEKPRFAADVVRALRPGGRVVVIDFAPGTLWFHGADHGVQPEAVVNAFASGGLRLRHRIDKWGGGMFLLLFERSAELRG